jgi:hypothetical protein
MNVSTRKQTVAAFVVAGLLVCSNLTAAQEATNPELGDVGTADLPEAQPAGSNSGTWSTSGQMQASQPIVAQAAAPVSVYQPPAVADSSSTTSSDEKKSEAADHDSVVGTFGIGFFGVNDIPIGALGQGSTPDYTKSIVAPTIGMRYWLSNKLGIEAGIGLGIESESLSINNTSSDPPSGFALALHGGVPLALAYSKHFVFEVVPELNIGFSTGTDYSTGGSNPDANTDLGGFLLQLGAHAGAEIHFGFIGIPQLALQGSIGIHFSYLSRSLSQKSSGTDISRSSIHVGTSSGASPWHIFTDAVKSITAIYYF